MKRLTVPALIAALAVLAAAPMAADAATKKPVHKAAAKPAAQPETPEVLTDGQMAEASHVFTGRAQCESKEWVDVEPVSGKPGHFDLHFGKAVYHMVPEETTTGAVRLHDKKADVVWLQIPAKSMLLDEGHGHRLVDGCQEEQQRTPGVTANAQ
jgi:hypothetical protein